MLSDIGGSRQVKIETIKERNKENEDFIENNA